MNINQHNCSLSDATMAALFIHRRRCHRELHTATASSARGARSGALTPIAFSQWTANEQLRNRIRKEEERKRQENRLPGLRLGCYSAFLNSAPRGFELVFGCHLWPTLVVQS